MPAENSLRVYKANQRSKLIIKDVFPKHAHSLTDLTKFPASETRGGLGDGPPQSRTVLWETGARGLRPVTQLAGQAALGLRPPAHGLGLSTPSPECKRTQGKMKEHEKIIQYKYTRTEELQEQE